MRTPWRKAQFKLCSVLCNLHCTGVPVRGESQKAVSPCREALVIFTKCHGGQQQPRVILRLKLRKLILLGSRHVNSLWTFKGKAALTVVVCSEVSVWDSSDTACCTRLPPLYDLNVLGCELHLHVILHTVAQVLQLRPHGKVQTLLRPLQGMVLASADGEASLAALWEELVSGTNVKIMNLSTSCVGYCVDYFCITVTKELGRNSSEEERVILSHDSSARVGSVPQGKAFHGGSVWQLPLIMVDQEAQS